MGMVLNLSAVGAAGIRWHMWSLGDTILNLDVD